MAPANPPSHSSYAWPLLLPCKRLLRNRSARAGAHSPQRERCQLRVLRDLDGDGGADLLSASGVTAGSPGTNSAAVPSDRRGCRAHRGFPQRRVRHGSGRGRRRRRPRHPPRRDRLVREPRWWRLRPWPRALGPRRLDPVRLRHGPDGDGDADVLYASTFLLGGDNEIAWYENLGGGAFGPSQVIPTSVDDASSVYATDLDGDEDADVLSASAFDSKIAWYENLGGGSRPEPGDHDRGLRPVRVRHGSGRGWRRRCPLRFLRRRQDRRVREPRWRFLRPDPGDLLRNFAGSVFATDLDGDGDADVLSASIIGRVVRESRRQVLGPSQVISLADAAGSVYAADLDGDGDDEVLSAGNEIAWHDNLGGGSADRSR